MVPVAYNLRSLAVRKTTTAATALGIALVVFVLSSVLMLSAGIERTLSSTGAADVAIVMRKGSDAELSSAVDSANTGLVLSQKGVRRRADGQPDGVGEVLVVISADKLGTDGMSNVSVRGVPDDVLAFRPEVTIVEGRAPKPGSDECLIGRAIRGRFRGLELGQKIELRKNRQLSVVGVMASGGSAFESEVWAGIDTIRATFGREGYVQSIRARLSSPEAYEAFERSVESNRQLGLMVEREDRFYEKQSEGTRLFITSLGTTIAFFFALGAMIGAMITMYAAVAQRKREIGCLRALGFGKVSIMASFLFESVALAALGGLVGALASCAMGLVSFSIVNFQSWSEMVFRFEPNPASVGTGFAFAVAMGVLGGFFPAVRAARMPLVAALKD
jgi:putative ABC transport system permease protein